MKRKVLYSGLVLLSLCVFFSCLDDDDDVYVSYGVIQNYNSARDYEILTDKGNTLVVTKSSDSQTIEEDKRVFVSYNILSDKDRDRKVYEVSVNRFFNLLSKPIVNESFILQDEEVRRDSIGNDPFNKINAEFGGNFINIYFEFLFEAHSNVKHMINLVYDDPRADADTIYLTLYHNAYGEVPGNNLYLSKGSGMCSFKLSDLLPAGVTSKAVKLTWTQYGYNNEPKERSDSGIFKLGGTAEPKSRITQHIELVSSVITR
jgi:hypothetical protein